MPFTFLFALSLVSPPAPAPSSADAALGLGERGSYCATTGICRPAEPRRLVPGVMFLATGLVMAGVALARPRRSPR
ncbi:MAG: hypothetical protein ACOY71_12825 [Gemmatimonadota bacterium]